MARPQIVSVSGAESAPLTNSFGGPVAERAVQFPSEIHITSWISKAVAHRDNLDSKPKRRNFERGIQNCCSILEMWNTGLSEDVILLALRRSTFALDSF